MSGFGDLEPDDVVALGDPDPEAVARILYRKVRRYAPDQPELDDLHPQLRAAVAFGMADTFAQMRREGTL
jgi:hypothetical protein